MGLFNRLKKEKQNVNQEPKEEKLLFDVKFSITSDGRLQVEFYDRQAPFNQFYDTTRLISSMETFDLGGRPVHNCIVSWYGENDAVMLNEKGIDMGRRGDYREVLAEIDLEQLKSDPNYCYMVMSNLLSKQRVERYLDKGLEENPDTPCGKYIGGVRKTQDNKYQKFFSAEAGKVCHYSDFMVERRKLVRERNEKFKQQQISEKEAQIKKLQEELDQMR